MKKVFMLFIALISCIGLIGCSGEKTTLEKLKSFTEQDDYNFSYLDDNNSFVVTYDDNFDGDCSIRFVDDNDKWTISYIPKHETFVFELDFEDETIPMMYDIENDEYNFYVDEDDYINYMFCEMETYEECIDKYSEKMKVDKEVKENLKEHLDKLESLLKKHDLEIKDIDVSYDDLSK